MQVTRLRRQIESDSRDQATYLVYDKRVKEMAAELTGKTSITFLVHQMWNIRLTSPDWSGQKHWLLDCSSISLLYEYYKLLLICFLI